MVSRYYKYLSRQKLMQSSHLRHLNLNDSFFSPPPEVEMSERRSRRDMSPQGRKRTAVMMSRDKQTPYQTHRKVCRLRRSCAGADEHKYNKPDPFQNGQPAMSQRSHSAAPTDSPSLHSRSRSKSPRRVGSLSPPETRMLPSHHTYVPRFASRWVISTQQWLGQLKRKNWTKE